ncbi:flagellar M-ring protein FliF [Lysinibacillus sp. 2017]|uniref:flagellar basal-body MS-ring/collar protein FliF n=1 Tax=unclassified Lysinibacillus TaxID=2636778 RepID=UPI000D5257F1|nr:MULTISPECIES: flagellar basal-body MS-ring/collar protein FliF [unclassified Lysinibacillus]AWE06672.1 flagellar M-ring protein FliF [Lysinibacillus sp. 2017]TGN37396.1 flagellar basal body M-ring protein FliF [Lysinibacillus sp. S2017]
MNERLTKIKSDSTSFWRSRTKNQKGAVIGAVVAIIALAAILTYYSTRTTMAQLFPELPIAEVGRITEVLSAQGVPYETANGGTTILVPEEQVDDLKVSLAAQGYPDSDEIDASFFTENAGFGMTDNEFNVIKKAATETDLANLIRKFDGVKDASVVITLPDEGIFLKDEKGSAQAAIVLKTAAGHKFTDEQIKGLFNLVSMSIPNLPKENITIMNQYSEYYDLAAAESGSSGVDSVTGQMEVKKTIERDLQRQVQQMLGTLIGQDKVVVNVSADVDFKKENREENLVKPVDEENMTGIEISAQRITETYSGSAAADGSPEAGNVTDNFVDYVEGSSGDGDYERVEETINNDVNRIKREIQESPYKIRNLGIQVMVDSPETEGINDSVRSDIEQILSTIVRTSIDQDAAGILTDEEIANRIVVSVQKFQGNDTDATDPQSVIPWWVWVIGGILLVAIILLVIYVLRARKRKQEEEELEIIEKQQQLIEVEDISEEKETEATVRRKQLEKMAKDKPEDFAKLLRSWIAED